LIKQQLEVLSRQLRVRRVQNQVQLAQPVMRIGRISAKRVIGEKLRERYDSITELSLSNQLVGGTISRLLPRLRINRPAPCLGSLMTAVVDSTSRNPTLRRPLQRRYPMPEARRRSRST
jgi:hypothetical protein